MMITAISLSGWLITGADHAPAVLFVLAFVGVIALVCGVLALHRRINRRIEQLGRL